mmetsp:Transcript_17563/g.52210  ORF Transcript_17563/g.52210 Transcript_17563/m.52210 type:complete len:104 (-) Transcript_17563:94-405(-)
MAASLSSMGLPCREAHASRSRSTCRGAPASRASSVAVAGGVCFSMRVEGRGTEAAVVGEMAACAAGLGGEEEHSSASHPHLLGFGGVSRLCRARRRLRTRASW